jgi:hypothetical protein
MGNKQARKKSQHFAKNKSFKRARNTKNRKMDIDQVHDDLAKGLVQDSRKYSVRRAPRPAASPRDFCFASTLTGFETRVFRSRGTERVFRRSRSTRICQAVADSTARRRPATLSAARRWRHAGGLALLLFLPLLLLLPVTKSPCRSCRAISRLRLYAVLSGDM